MSDEMEMEEFIADSNEEDEAYGVGRTSEQEHQEMMSNLDKTRK